MKRLILFALTILTTIGCKQYDLNNSSLEFDTINVNFSGTLADKIWTESDEVGIFSTVTRAGVQDVAMSTNTNARYKTRIADGTVYFAQVSDDDQIIAESGDHNFKFYAYYPYSSTNADISALQVEVPATQQYALGVENYGLYIANKQVTTVVPTVGLDFKGIFSTIELHVPDDIVDEDGNTVIRSLLLRPTVADNFNGVLVDGGTYNLETGVLTSNPDMQHTEVEVDFGSAGLMLTESYTKVSIAVAPFTVPEGGFEVVVQDINGFETIVDILHEDDDEGIIFPAGAVYTHYLSRDNDGIIPVTFPVVFPVGIVGGVQSNNPTTQPRWVSDGIWTSPTQPQAHAQWYKVSDPAPSPLQFRQFVNSGVISTPEVRGVWTGDYLEFVLPVRRFAAGTAVTMKHALYTRQGPIFWNIEYYDEGEWKTLNKSSLTTDFPLDNATHEATFFLRYDEIGRVIEHTMVFNDAIQSGHLRIRLTCADGSKQAAGASVATRTVAVRTTPFVSGSAYGAPFYFRSADGEQDSFSVTFSIN